MKRLAILTCITLTTLSSAWADFTCPHTLTVNKSEGKTTIVLLSPSSIFDSSQLLELSKKAADDSYLGSLITKVSLIFKSSSCVSRFDDERLISCHTTAYAPNESRNLDEYVIIENYQGDTKILHLDVQRGKDNQNISFMSGYATETFFSREQSGYRIYSGFKTGNHASPAMLDLNNYGLSVLNHSLFKCSVN